jgi:hypothetical protein
MKSTYHDPLPSYQSGDVCNVRLVAQGEQWALKVGLEREADIRSCHYSERICLNSRVFIKRDQV